MSLDANEFRVVMGRVALLWPVPGQTEAELEIRLEEYWETLDPLLTTEELWAAFKLAKERCVFPPKPAELLTFATEFRKGQWTPPTRRTPEQIEADREAARDGLRQIQAAVKEAEALPPAAAEPDTVITVSDERLDQLKRQAAAILETPATPAEEAAPVAAEEA